MATNQFEQFISKRLRTAHQKQFSNASLRFSVWSISLGLIVMLLSISIVTGFQEKIRMNMARFEGHIQISKFDNNKSFDLNAIDKYPELETQLIEYKRIKSISAFASKGAVLKNKELIQGCVIKGIDANYRWSDLKEWLVAGRLPNYNDSIRSNEILISKQLSNKIGASIGDAILFYFMQEPLKARKWTVVGIYESGFQEFDQRYIIADLRQLQRINQWQANQISGYEIELYDFNEMSQVTADIYEEINYDLRAINLNEHYPFIMDWLKLLDTNVYFILSLMMLISSIGMIATLLILILEKTQAIGTLKALGATDASIRKIFIYQIFFLLLKGLFFGNIIGLGLAFIQWKWNLIPLDADNYYMNSIPISWPWEYFLLLNVAIIIIIAASLWLPSRIISRISPIKSLKFE